MAESNLHPFFFEEEAEESFASTQGKGKITEEERHETPTMMDFVIRMEVPGVEASHITIEEKNGEIEIVAIRMDSNNYSQTGGVAKTYQDVFFIHPAKADLSRLEATLTDGILTVRVPKSAPPVVKVEVESTNPPPPPPPPAQASNTAAASAAAPSALSDDEDMKDNDASTDPVPSEETRFSMDLPGVSPNNVFLRIDDDHVWLKAIRRRISKNANSCPQKFCHAWDLPVSADKMQAKAYLHNGVLTLVIPPHHVVDVDAAESVGLRTFYAIPVTASAATSPNSSSVEESKDDDEEEMSLPGVASLRLDASSSADAPIVVETVQEWERVEASTSDPEDQKPAASN